MTTQKGSMPRVRVLMARPKGKDGNRSPTIQIVIICLSGQLILPEKLLLEFVLSGIKTEVWLEAKREELPESNTIILSLEPLKEAQITLLRILVPNGQDTGSVELIRIVPQNSPKTTIGLLYHPNPAHHAFESVPPGDPLWDQE